MKKRQATPTSLPRRGRGRYIQYFALLAGTILIVDAFVGDKGVLAMLQARERFEMLEQSLADVRAENAKLREDARRLREDPTAIEELARRELGLIKPGEKLFIVRDIAPKDPR